MVDVGGAPIDRYVVLEHLSEGGMGAIYVGKKLGAGGFEMEVVLKQLLPEFTQQEEFIDLFLREAKLSATLDHANIVHTIDLVTAGGEYFIVMEYLPGGDLRTLLKRAKRRGRRFSPAAAIYISRELLSALAYAHVKRDFDGKPLKLIHRDVSPSNILVSYAGEVKLTDFGIAKAATHNSLFYKVKGKIGYMSPEQAKSEPLDHRSDLYSLAVCLYEVLTGERLFVHAGITTSADEIYSQPVPQVSRKIPGLTTDLDKIMAKALALDPDQRYQTAGELNEALTRCAHRNGLLMSAPELARELLDACGPIDQWRADDDDDDYGVPPRAGTEVYDAGGDDEDEGSLGPMSIHNIAARLSSDPRTSRPKTEVGRYKGVELTSIINMIDLETKQSVMASGAQPLVDLNVGPKIMDSGPRGLFDSAPELASQLAPSGGRPAPDVNVGMPMNLEGPTILGHPGSVSPMPPAMQAPRADTPPPLSQHEMLHAPRRLPSTNPPAAPRIAEPRAGSSMRRKRPSRGKIKPWMVILAILLAAAIATMIIAMSGPHVAVQGK
ncbi:MAG TPA: serine/threonine-protein kinase [Kofleriaceae bacterium]|nr:serine/threonine-protein kinase [Kofleriaceae bacterium]